MKACLESRIFSAFLRRNFLRRRMHSRAFSLVELMVVVVILALFAAMTLSSAGLGSGPDYEIRSLARRVAGTMERSKQQAGITGRLVRLVYDFDNQQIYLLVPEKPDTRDNEVPEEFDEEDAEFHMQATFNIGEPGDREGSSVWLDSVQTYDGESYDSGQIEIDVRPIGSSTGHVVRLYSRNDEYLSIEMNPLTGTPHIYQGTKEVEEPISDSRY